MTSAAALELCVGGPVEHVTHLVVGWAATDANAHMRSTAYLDAVNDCRVAFFHRGGWSLERFRAAGIGPVLLREEIAYRRELRMGDAATVDQALAGLSPDGSRWKLRNTVRHDGGAVAATVTSAGSWVDLERRRLVAPPLELFELLASLPYTDDHEVLRASVLPRSA